MNTHNNNATRAQQRFYSILCGAAFKRSLAAGSVVALSVANEIHGLITPANEVTQATLALCSFLLISYAGIDYFKGGYYSLKSAFQCNNQMDMSTLVTLSSALSFCYGVFLLLTETVNVTASLHQQTAIRFLTAPSITLLALNISATLKDRINCRIAEYKSDIIKTLKRRLSEHAEIVADSKITRINSKQIKPGDQLSIKAGEHIPTDGTIDTGASRIHEYGLTNGEFSTISKGPGQWVYAGSRTQTGITMTASTTQKDSRLAQTIRRIKFPKRKRNSLQELSDKISQWFVPLTIGISLTSGIAWGLSQQDANLGLRIVMNVWMGACPCTFGLAIPLSQIISNYLANKEGILLQTPAILPLLARIKSIAFDLTGTLTKPTVQEFDALDQNCDTTIEILTHVKSIELALTQPHPVRDALLEYINSRSDCNSAHTPDELTAHAQGIEAVIAQHTYHIGSSLFMQQSCITIPRQYSDTDQQQILIAQNKRIVGRFLLQHEVKPEAQTIIEYFNQKDINLSILTGATHQASSNLSHILNITTHSSLTAAQKAQYITSLPSPVLMLGDELNDTLAVEQADIGVSFRHHSLSAHADITLGNSLLDLIKAITIADDTLKNIKQNLSWALCYNLSMMTLYAVILPLTHTQLAPGYAGAIMAGSSLLVVLNAMRLLRREPSPQQTDDSIKQNPQHYRRLV
jgi:cation transport ATPase